MKSNESKIDVIFFVLTIATLVNILIVALFPNAPDIFRSLKTILGFALILCLVSREIISKIGKHKHKKEKLLTEKEMIERKIFRLSAQYKIGKVHQEYYKKETRMLKKRLSQIEEEIREKKYIG